MSKITNNIGLHITSAEDGSKTFLEFRTELAGDGDDSNMVIIDNEIGALKTINEKQVTWGMLLNGLNSAN